MRTHADAIHFFRARGLRASRRVWALGDTVVLPFGPEEPDRDGIIVYRFMAWLVPGSGGEWHLVHEVFLHERRLSFASLERACEAGLRLLALQEPHDACPACGGRRRLDFGERYGAGKWHLSTSCAGCGARSEADGEGSLPEDLRALELARNGRWSVVVRTLPDASCWRTIREALGLDVAALSALKRRIPGAVFEGTFLQAHYIRGLFHGQGADAELAEVPPEP